MALHARTFLCIAAPDAGSEEEARKLGGKRREYLEMTPLQPEAAQQPQSHLGMIRSLVRAFCVAAGQQESLHVSKTHLLTGFDLAYELEVETPNVFPLPKHRRAGYALDVLLLPLSPLLHLFRGGGGLFLHLPLHVQCSFPNAHRR